MHDEQCFLMQSLQSNLGETSDCRRKIPNGCSVYFPLPFEKIFLLLARNAYVIPLEQSTVRSTAIQKLLWLHFYLGRTRTMWSSSQYFSTCRISKRFLEKTVYTVLFVCIIIIISLIWFPLPSLLEQSRIFVILQK